MNTNDQANLRKCRGRSVIELLWIISAITVLIPLLTIYFDANETDPERVDGILVRNIGIREKVGIPIVNLISPPLRFGSEEGRRLVGGLSQKKTVNAAKSTVDSLSAIGAAVIQKAAVFSPVKFAFDDLDQSAVQAQINQVNPLALTLPAARGNFTISRDGRVTDAKGEVLGDIVPVAKLVKTETKKIPVARHLDDESSQFESAQDFVASLHDAYQSKGLLSD